MMAVADVDEVLAALAEPTRRAVVDRLREEPRRPGEVLMWGDQMVARRELVAKRSG